MFMLSGVIIIYLKSPVLNDDLIKQLFFYRETNTVIYIFFCNVYFHTI